MASNLRADIRNQLIFLGLILGSWFTNNLVRIDGAVDSAGLLYSSTYLDPEVILSTSQIQFFLIKYAYIANREESSIIIRNILTHGNSEQAAVDGSDQR